MWGRMVYGKTSKSPAGIDCCQWFRFNHLDFAFWSRNLVASSDFFPFSLVGCFSPGAPIAAALLEFLAGFGGNWLSLAALYEI